MVEQGIYKGTSPVSWRRMYNKAGRFIQHYQIGVFVKDRQGNGLGLAGDGLGSWELTPDNVPGSCHIAGFLSNAVNRNVARPNQSTHIGAGQSGKPRCYDRIEPATSR
jgi:hypothetical protein